MSTTWYDIKLATLQKMFAADGDTIPNDNSTRDYLASMPGAANEALQRLSTVGKYIKKSIDIAHNPIKNLLGDMDSISSSEGGELEFYASGCHSAYFEYYGGCTLKVKVNGTTTETITLDNNSGYTSYRLLIPNVNEKVVTLFFESDYPFALKNVAMYKAKFRNVADVQPYSKVIRYNLPSLANDFYELSTEDIYYEGSADISRYVRTSDFFQEGNKVLVLDRNIPGNFKIYYNAYPQKITSDTPDDEVLAIDDEVAVLMPLYMASELYKDDDVGIATQYRNYFEVALEDLKKKVSTPSSEKFVSKGGWV